MTTEEQRLVVAGQDAELLLVRGNSPHRPCLENRVAYQWEMEGDIIGQWCGHKRNALTLKWLESAVNGPATPGGARAALDVGCAFGNTMLMLNSRLGKRPDVRLVGVDLHEEGVRYAQSFAKSVPGYSNCEFLVADLSIRLPFEDHTFDAVNLGDVLEHMQRPGEALRELARVSKPGAVILIGTPLKDGLIKRVARIVNRVSGGRVYKSYYSGKDTQLDGQGNPVMITKAGLDHVSEMSFGQLRKLIAENGLTIEQTELMPVMSGSRWFDRHPFLLAFLMLFEAVHGVLRRPSWAHGVRFLVRVPK